MTSPGARAHLAVREYRPSDLEACLDVFDSCVPRYFRDPERGEYRTFLESLPGPYLVLTEEDGAIVACGGYAAEGRGRVTLCWGMVRSGLHGTGLGRALTEARIARAVADPDVLSIVLSTSQLTSGFYERMGFSIVSVDPDGFGPGLDRCDMRLDLGDEAARAKARPSSQPGPGPAELRIDLDLDMAVFQPRGPMTVERLKGLLTQMLEHPDFHPGMPSLWDMTDCDMSQIDQAGMKRLAAFHHEKSEERGRARVALFTTKELDFGILRQLEGTADVPTASTRTFRDRAAAELWVKDG